jgi:hypothetical protein
MGKKARLGEILVEAGVIDAAQLEAALSEQKETGRPLGVILVRMGSLDEDTLVRRLSKQLGVPMARLKGKRVRPDVLDLVPCELADEHQCFPLFVKKKEDADTLYLAMEDPSELDVVEAVAAHAGMEVRPVLVAPTELDEALHRHYHWDALGPQTPLQPAPDEEEKLDSAPPLSLAEMPDLEAAAPQAAEFDPPPPAPGGLAAGETLDTLPDLDVPSPLGAPGPAETPLPPLQDSDPGFDSDPLAPDDSFGESVGELEPELLSLESEPAVFEIEEKPDPAERPEPERAGSVSQEAILRALSQLLVEKGVITRDELVERVRRFTVEGDADFG